MFQEIYKKGGRKFGFANSVPLGCLPKMRALNLGNQGACVEEINTIVKLHNRVLAKVLLKLKGELNGFKYSNPNVYSNLYDITNNPSKHGNMRPPSFSFSLSFVSVIR